MKKGKIPSINSELRTCVHFVVVDSTRKARSPLRSLRSLVAGPGIAPGLEDYEPSVRLYTTPHVSYMKERF